MAESLERIGQIIGEYRLLRWLGGGGFGHVYLAESVHGEDQVAIKVLQMRLTQRDDLRSFLNEARTIHLKHPHIVPLLDFGLSDRDTPFLVMEYAPRGTLRQRHPKGSHVPLLTAVTYATQIASALQYAHEARLVHRDVKPENMLLRSDDVLLLSDFGIATIAHSTDSVNAVAGIGGTVPYMAPEQLDGKPRPQSDQYALAVVVYEWLAGRCPFQGTAVEIALQHATKAPPSLREQVPGLSQEVEDVLFKALAKDPKDRFASIQAFAEALQQASQPQGDCVVIPLSEQGSLSTEQKISPESTIRLSQLPVARPNDEQPLENQLVATLSVEHTLDTSGSTEIALIEPIQPISQVSPLAKKKRVLSRGRILVLIAAILALVGSGSFAYPALQTYEAHVQAMATVTAEYNVYNEAVARICFRCSHG